MEESLCTEKKGFVLKDWGKTVLEVAKWALVLWLLWPIRQHAGGSTAFTRVVIGVVLFIIFAGKLFYDTVIMGMIQQRRTSVKQDVVTLIGMTLVAAVLVGLLLFFLGFFVIELIRMSSSPPE